MPQANAKLLSDITELQRNKILEILNCNSHAVEHSSSHKGDILNTFSYGMNLFERYMDENLINTFSLAPRWYDLPNSKYVMFYKFTSTAKTMVVLHDYDVMVYTTKPNALYTKLMEYLNNIGSVKNVAINLKVWKYFRLKVLHRHLHNMYNNDVTP